MLIAPQSSNWHSRANRLREYAVYRPTTGSSRERWVYLCGTDEMAQHLTASFPGQFSPQAVPPDLRMKFTHCLHVAGGVTQDMVSLLELLKTVLTINTRRSQVRIALAFDFYKTPQDNVNPNQWPNTEVGELVYRAKYWKSWNPGKRKALDNLVASTVTLLNTHPLAAKCGYILTAPGHENNGTSFGEGFAQAVAIATGKTLINTECKEGPRVAAKTGNESGAQFHISSTYRGSAIIIDDVYRSGATMDKVARAARKAGFSGIFGFAAVKTLRN